MSRPEESKLYKHIRNGSREMAEHLRALATVLPEEPVLTFSKHCTLGYTDKCAGKALIHIRINL